MIGMTVYVHTEVTRSYDKNTGDSGSQPCPRMSRGINQEEENVLEICKILSLQCYWWVYVGTD